MTPCDPAVRGLSDTALSLRLTDEEIAARQREIHEGVLAQSRYLRSGNFREIHTDDLALLYTAYDKLYFGGQCRAALAGRPLLFQLSRRMTRAGGRTKMVRFLHGGVHFEIAVAASLLFQGFGPSDREIRVCGLPCADRLHALQRVFEHELVHLLELLCWETSNCSAERFQEIAGRLFLHRAHTHELITHRERAGESGIQPGARVSFSFEGRQLTGVVNRVTKRATVLVPDGEGRRYSDGMKYKVYYVPVRVLQLLSS